MITSKRILIALFVLSLAMNIFFVGFLSTAAHALANPEEAIRNKIEKTINGLPEKYRTPTQQKYDEFLAKYQPLIDETRQERKTFLHMLLAPNVDVKQAEAQAQKIRGITAQLQQGMQDAIIDIAAGLPEEEKAKIVENSRALKAVVE